MDDILIVTEQEELENLGEDITKEFHWITMAVNNEPSYLGMQIKVANGEVSVDMRYYLHKVLAKHDNLQVAKLLYLSKWARPDIISNVGFLCTRVKAPY